MNLDNLNMMKPQDTLALFAALNSYIEGRPVIVKAPNGAVLHGLETLQLIAAGEVTVECTAIPDIAPYEFVESDWPEFLEAARRVWMSGERPHQSYIDFVRGVCAEFNTQFGMD